MRMLLVMIIITVSGVFADTAVNIERHGRRVQTDGFLLEWNPKDAMKWGGSLWLWDAQNTADGVAGYFSSAARACSGWAFTISAAHKIFEMKIPEQAAGAFFAFDKGSFDSEGIHNVEWIIPWDAFEKDAGANTYKLTLNAISDCGDTLPEITATVIRKNAKTSKAGAMSMYIIMALTGFVTLVLAALRRRRDKKQHIRNTY